MNVRELINDALRVVGVNKSNVENQSGQEFKDNVRIVRRVGSGLRLYFPFRSVLTFTPAELDDLPFVQVETVVAFNTTDGVRFPMVSMTREEYNYYAVVPNVTGIPRRYLFEEIIDGGVAKKRMLVYPLSSSYDFEIVGKVNNFEFLTSDSDLSPAPDFMQDFLLYKVARRLASAYGKDWSMDNKAILSDLESTVIRNTDQGFDFYSMEASNNLDRWVYRPKNWVK